MKKTILSILTLAAIAINVNAQNVNIPDANFKAYLVGNASINTNGDAEIQVSEANAFNGTIHCANLSIADLTGIESFAALTQLYCFSNSLNNLDVSNNTNLTHFNFSGNSISNINVSNNTNLTLLVCEDNTLSSLDVSNNAVLDGLYFNNNSLTSLNVANNTSLAWISGTNNLLGSLDLSNNTALEEVYLNDNQLTYLNVSNGNNVSITNFVISNNPSLTCIEVDDVAYSAANWTNIDAASSFSTNCPPPPCIVNIPDANFKAYLVGDASINTNGDTEIQCNEASAFTGVISCASLSISDLTGIEAFTNLTQLFCQDNNLSSLDVSQNTNLWLLRFGNNGISSIDLSQNTALTNLNCNNTSLGSLDVSQNVALIEIYCIGNQLTNLDVSQNTNLLTLNCSNNSLSNLDVSQNTDLYYLYCDNNSLTSLDVSQNINLNRLTVNSNLLTDIDLSQNSSLVRFSCMDNLLNGLLDISVNTDIAVFNCSDNLLTGLNVANGNNSNFTLFNASFNPNLTCIQVDDEVYSTANWTNIGAQASFSNNCIVLVSSITVQGQGGANTITTTGGTLQMEATVLPANADDMTYTWSVMDGSGTATIDANGLLTGITNGTVTVIANANDASNVAGTATITISNQSVGLNENALSELIGIYPNPVQNELFIDVKNIKINQLEVIDYTGRRVKTISSKQVKSIDVSNLTQGVYVLKVVTEKGISTKQFIKK